jgi:hypothetical protein
MLSNGAGGVDIGAIIGQLVGHGVSRAIVSAIVGLIMNNMRKACSLRWFLVNTGAVRLRCFRKLRKTMEPRPRADLPTGPKARHRSLLRPYSAAARATRWGALNSAAFFIRSNTGAKAGRSI